MAPKDLSYLLIASRHRIWATRLDLVRVDFRLRLWWNWQTRYFEVVVGKPVQVQVLLSAPIFAEKNADTRKVLIPRIAARSNYFFQLQIVVNRLPIDKIVAYHWSHQS